MRNLARFYINHAKFQHYSDRAIDWLIKSWIYDKKTYQWKICRLKMLMYKEEAMKYLERAGKELKECLS